MQVVHLPLEKHPDRYTADLSDWESVAFISEFGPKGYVRIEPPSALSGLPNTSASAVLEPHRRTAASFAQVNSLVKILAEWVPQHRKAKHALPAVWLSDFFTPGIEGLWYCGLHDVPVYAMFWAQTADQFDFTRGAMCPFMRQWENMAMEHYAGIFVASTELKDRVVTIWPQHAAKVFCLDGGLPYNSKVVAKTYSTSDRPPLASRQFDLVWTSRWAPEKQPWLFVEALENTNLKGLLLSGVPNRSLDNLGRNLRERVTKLEQSGRLVIRSGLSRQAYFDALKTARIQVNTSLQDWVSFTLLDALCAGCLPLYPLHRSFMEVFRGYEEYTYASPGMLTFKANEFRSLLMEGTTTLSGLTHAGHPIFLGKFVERTLRISDLALTGIARLIYVRTV